MVEAKWRKRKRNVTPIPKFKHFVVEWFTRV